jgi:cysteine desulfurase
MSVYLDNAATTKPCVEAVAAAVDAMTVNYGNPSSLHRTGLNAQLVVDKSRKIIASSLGCEEKCIYFTSGATESNNLALRGTVAAYGKRRKKIITSAAEHSSVLATVNDLEKNGFEVVRIHPRNDGKFHAEDFIDAVDENTCIISMMLVNNETGAILPVAEVFNAVKRRYPDTVTHCDCVQGYMKIQVKANRLNADLISISGHKVNAVKGIGALYIKKGVRVLPVITGGGQEKGIRSGTENVPAIASFGAAVEKLAPTIVERYDRAAELKKLLLSEISDIDGVEVNSPSDGSPYITNISAIGRRSEIMLHYLEHQEIYVSSGSACSKGAKSGVLHEFGISDKNSDSAIRISFSCDTTEEDITEFVRNLRNGIKEIRVQK